MVKVKVKVLGEKAMKAIKGGDVCCWDGGGCDCTSSGGAKFFGISDGWLTEMEGSQE